MCIYYCFCLSLCIFPPICFLFISVSVSVRHIQKLLIIHLKEQYVDWLLISLSLGLILMLWVGVSGESHQSTTVKKYIHFTDKMTLQIQFIDIIVYCIFIIIQRLQITKFMSTCQRHCHSKLHLSTFLFNLYHPQISAYWFKRKFKWPLLMCDEKSL